MTSAVVRDAALTAARILLRGQVQGIGVRPAVANLAMRCELRGSVGNGVDGVVIVLEGTGRQLARFRRLLGTALPRPAIVDQIDWRSVPPAGLRGFTILEGHADGPPSVPVPGDRGVCAECVAEATAESGRRAGYALTSCTQCGPRYTIIDSLPYERRATTMRGFELCPECRREDTSPADRRFHAQTNACPVCGPQVWGAGQTCGRIDSAADVLRAAAATLLGGGIVALRGVGGYQLVCDATSESAVARLRGAKGRPEKPFAVMVENLAAIEAASQWSAAERDALTDPANPIVIIDGARPPIARSVAGGLNSCGVLLATTPLHVQILRACQVPLVVTSGNRDGDPLAVAPADAERDLVDVADFLIHHNRPIAHAIDDSVVRVIAGRTVSIRSARGLAPRPLAIDLAAAGLAVGGHQKVALAVGNGVQSALGPHLGDLDSLRMRARFESHVDELLDLYRARPVFVAGDLHPDYFTSRWLQQFAVPQVAVTEQGIVDREPCARQPAADASRRVTSPALADVQCVVRVQHHHAHIAAGMIDAGWSDREVLGFAFDGTGYGHDGTIWGGEILKCTLTSFHRVGRLRPLALAGGEAAIREPWRIALALLRDTFPDDDVSTIVREFAPAGLDATSLSRVLGNERLSPRTSSAGRLFDGVAALVLGMSRATYEGQPAAHLEDACDPHASGSYQVPVRPSTLLELDWRPMIRDIVADRRAGLAPGRMAMKFHRGLAAAVADVCRRFDDLPVVLGGGVFQNRRLVEQIAEQAPVDRLGLPGTIPPNDGGLAAGQFAIAARVLARFSPSAR